MPYQTDPDDPRYKEGDREVRHTIIRLIRDHLRLPYLHPHSWQGLHLDFTAVTFDGGDFRGAEFSDGLVSFDDARFSDGTVTFDDAKFSGGTVSFRGAEFSGGRVDMRSVASWAMPPRFEASVRGNPPAGLLLPSPQ
ncbi:hypothetical protein ACWCQZ_06005 [Streptomyces sp. NPDC002285]